MHESPMFEHELEQIKAALAQTLFEQIGLDVGEALGMVDRFYGEIAASLASGENVELEGFGYFSLRDGFFSGSPYLRGPALRA